MSLRKIYYLVLLTLIGSVMVYAYVQRQETRTWRKSEPVSTSTPVLVRAKPKTPIQAGELKPAQFKRYSDELYNKLLASNEPYALFFYSLSCGTCVQKSQQLSKQIADYPAGTTIVQIDFFTERQDLREQYGVTTWDTFVVVNKDGEASTHLELPLADLKTMLGSSGKIDMGTTS